MFASGMIPCAALLASNLDISAHDGPIPWVKESYVHSCLSSPATNFESSAPLTFSLYGREDRGRESHMLQVIGYSIFSCSLSNSTMADIITRCLQYSKGAAIGSCCDGVPRQCKSALSAVPEPSVTVHTRHPVVRGPDRVLVDLVIQHARVCSCTLPTKVHMQFPQTLREMP